MRVRVPPWAPASPSEIHATGGGEWAAIPACSPRSTHQIGGALGRRTEFALAILNGAIGDHLARTDNGLATGMQFVRDGASLPIDRAAAAGRRIVVLVHGLMCTEDAWAMEDGSDYGSLLAEDLGYAPLYLRFNSGRAIADNGASLAALLEELVSAAHPPIEEILLLGYSLGGLVIRSACHKAAEANGAWLPLVRRAIYVGTPHRGAPLERLGRITARILRTVNDPYTRLIAEVANLRSAGVKDLGDADLRHEDRPASANRLSLRDRRHPVPLLPSIDHLLVAGALREEPSLALFFGDSMIPVPSATDGACASPASLALPPENVRIVAGIAHIDLPRRRAVYEELRNWCSR